jgi:cell fate regulator YaaT (PSP1 superfamily)
MSGCSGCAIGNPYNAGGNYVGIRLNENEDGRVLFCETNGASLSNSAWLIVESPENGNLDFAQVTTLHPVIAKGCQVKNARRLVRTASETDLETHRQKTEREKRIYDFIRDRAAALALEMKLVRGQLSYDGRKLSVYYTSESRIDYRQLVRELVQAYGVRVEMRQIGVRDETKMRGGIGPCGKTLCCSTFLESFHPVTIKMAKNQNLSLNPSKISGMCGRLMCCLAYEDEGAARAS